MEYYSAIKMNEMLPSAETQMDLETVMQSEVSQKEKNKYWATVPGRTTTHSQAPLGPSRPPQTSPPDPRTLHHLLGAWWGGKGRGDKLSFLENDALGHRVLLLSLVNGTGVGGGVVEVGRKCLLYVPRQTRVAFSRRTAPAHPCWGKRSLHAS